MTLKHNLTEPQVNLLLRLRKQPRHIVEYYRPLQPLVMQELVRPRACVDRSTVYIYELTSKGKTLATEIIESMAAAEDARSHLA